MERIALRYASYAWNLLFCQKQVALFDSVREVVKGLVDSVSDYRNRRLLGISNEEWKVLVQDTIPKWKTLLDTQQPKWAELLEGAQEDFKFAQAKYQKYRFTHGLPVFQPQFFIDAHCAISHLRIQKYYDVLREALHIGSFRITVGELHNWRMTHKGRTYYTGSALITPDLLPAAEIAELKAEGAITHGIRYFIPADIAKLAEARKDGFPRLKEERDVFY
ncbi:hypothetical protein IFR05_014820 [Cadophora sp. M221]|nr:hypothetical protein IFR05_014820 [Cadophora sp. M221]